MANSSAGPTPSDVPRLWRLESRGGAQQVRDRAQRHRLFMLLALGLALVAAIVGLLTQLRPAPRPYFLPLYVTHERTNELSWVPLARTDLRAFSLRGYFSRVLGRPGAPQQRTRMAEGLAALAKLDPSDTVVVDIASLARTLGKGQVFFFPDDAESDDPKTWLSLDEVLEWIKACPAGRKLLILETTRQPVEPLVGTLAVDAAAAIAAVLKNHADDPDLLVLCSSAPGQTALDDEELGRSVFSFYLEEGLRGWADHDPLVGNRDGLVSVRELAEFVAARVDRWAMLNQASRQTPFLTGPAGLDFPLAAVAHSRPRPHMRITPARKYPAWLHAAWKDRDAHLSAGNDRLAPRAFRRMVEALLDAERAWRGGADSEALHHRWTALRPDLEEAFTRAREFPAPRQPRSLGLASLLGHPPDEPLATAAAQVAAKQREQAAALKPDEADKLEAKLAAEFLDAAKGKTEFDVAGALFDAAADDPRPRPGVIRFLDKLLTSVQREPLYVETHFLHKLVERADPQWSIETVRRALDVVHRGERAQARPASLSWVRPLLDHAAQVRHEGERLLWLRGYVPPDRADALLTQADAELEVVRNDQDTIEAAFRTRDHALALLADTARALGRIPGHAPVWEQAAGQVHDVDQALADLAAQAQKTSSGGFPDAIFQQHVETLQHAGELLRTSLDELRQPFGHDAANRLLRQSADSDAGPTLVSALDAVLMTAQTDADNRAKLWAARSAVARRLLVKTIELDQQSASPESTPAAGPTDVEAWESRAVQVAGDRAQVSIALLALAGRQADALRALETERSQLIDSRAPLTGWATLAQRLRTSWTRNLGQQFAPDDLRGLDRLSRVLPASIPLPALDRRRSNPTAELCRRELTALWAWLADRYDYQSRDVDPDPFFATAAREYLALARPLPEPLVRLEASSAPTEVTALHPSETATIQVELRHTREAIAGLNLRILKPDDDWLEVRPALPELAPEDSGSGDEPGATFANYSLARIPDGPFTVSLQVDRKPGADRSDTAPPLGFLVEVALGGRSFAVRVPVGLQPTGDRPQVLLSAEDRPSGPATTLGELRVRPAKARQPFYLYVHNPGKATRTVLVELKAGSAVVGGELPKLTLGAGQTQKVVFPGPIPKPTEPLEPLAGPLRVRLIDPDHGGATVQERTFLVNIATPVEYVKVSEIRFEPAGPKNDGKNRLTVALQAAVPVLDPPCPVELVLPPDRIPGFTSVKDGTFHGVLPDKPEKPLVLFAEDLQLSAAGEEQGEFFLTIDGIPRAMIFRTTFARQGAANTPRREVRTQLTLHAADALASGVKYQVAVEVDNAPLDSRLEMNLARFQDGVNQNDVVLPPFPTAKRRFIGFSPSGPGGAMLLEASIDDWTVALDTAGIQGRRELQAKLIDGDGRTVKTASLPVVLDVETPKLVRFMDPPAQAKRGSTVKLKAIGAATESGIKQVVFFVGKPEDGKVPPKAERADARRVVGEPSAWSGELRVPEDKKGPTEVSVQFINGAGLSSFDTISIELLDNEPVPVGGIAGKILEGTLPQKDLEVLLGNDKGAVVARTTSGADGTFRFDGLPKGSYQLYTTKVPTGTVGRAIVDVTPGESKPVELILYR